MAMHVLFMHNLMTQEDFVASIDAADVESAKKFCRMTYPAASYAVQACHALAELETILTNLKRWPGVPSKVQPTENQVQKRVQASVGGLPPLRREPTPGYGGTYGGATGGTVVTETQKAEELSLMMRMMAEQRAKRLGEDQQTPYQAPALPADSVAQAKTENDTTPNTVAYQAQLTQRVSVLEALRGAKGPAQVAQQAQRPAPVQQPYAGQSAAGNSSKSVVELLRGLRG